MTKRKAAIKATAAIGGILKKKIVKKPTKKVTKKKQVERNGSDMQITVAPTVSLNVPKKTKVLFKDGVAFVSQQDEKLFHKLAFTKAGGSAGALHFRWKSLGVEAIEFFTAHGDGTYGVHTDKHRKGEGEMIWVDSGSIFIITEENLKKLVSAKVVEEFDAEVGGSFGVPSIEFQGTITAHEDGYATGSQGLKLDTR